MPSEARLALHKLRRLRRRFLDGEETDTNAGQQAKNLLQKLPPLSHLPPSLAGQIAHTFGLLQGDTGWNLTPKWTSSAPGPLVTVTRDAARRVLDAHDDLESMAQGVHCFCEDSDHAYPPNPGGHEDHRADPLAVEHLRKQLAGQDAGELKPLPEPQESPGDD